MTVLGIDISAAQHPISDADWEIIANRYGFVYIENGLGNDRPSSTFDQFVAQAKNVGIRCGAYNFVEPLPTEPTRPGRDPREQAKAHFASCKGLGTAPGDLMVMTDLEYPAPDLWGKPVPNVPNSVVNSTFVHDWILTYQDEAKAQWGYYPILYSYRYFLAKLGPSPDYAAFLLWLADYSDAPHVPPPWTVATIWQESGGTGAKLPSGCNVDVDAIADQATLDSITITESG